MRLLSLIEIQCMVFREDSACEVIDEMKVLYVSQFKVSI